MAESISLAVLENLVHLDWQDFPTGYVVVGALIPNEVEVLSSEGFREEEGSLEARVLGDHWLSRGRSAVLKIPSVIVPSEFNYLLNPLHPEFSMIVAEMPTPFEFDERLFRFNLKQ